jgi:hypothetical protein
MPRVKVGYYRCLPVTRSKVRVMATDRPCARHEGYVGLAVQSCGRVPTPQ